MFNFFVNKSQINNKNVIITGDDYNHIANVLRMKPGEKIIITNKDNPESFCANIKTIGNQEVICEILNKRESTESNIDITVFQGITKSDKMDYIIQKSTELGMNNLVPVDMKYCIGKIKDESKKIERWQKIAEVAAKQSKRTKIPHILGTINVDDICKQILDFDIVLVAYENEQTITIKEALEKYSAVGRIAVVIGPEGGFSTTEIEKLEKAGAIIISIGKRILRTETASVAILSMIMYEYEL